MLLCALLASGCSSALPKRTPGSTQDAPNVNVKVRLKPTSEVQRHWQSVYEELFGSPYRLGGRAPSGFDCSGLVQYAYREFDGRRLPRTTADLFRCGRPVQGKPLSTGDLLFYRTDGTGPSHVGIYLWAGWFLHASNGEGVTFSRLDEPYYAGRFLGARRL